MRCSRRWNASPPWSSVISSLSREQAEGHEGGGILVAFGGSGGRRRSADAEVVQGLLQAFLDAVLEELDQRAVREAQREAAQGERGAHDEHQAQVLGQALALVASAVDEVGADLAVDLQRGGVHLGCLLCRCGSRCRW